MNLRGILHHLPEDPGVSAAREAATSRGLRTLVAPAGVRPALTALLAADRPIVVVTANGKDAEDVAASLESYLAPEEVAILPAWETLPHERLSPRADTVARRLAVFRRLAHPDPDIPGAGPLRVVIVPVRSLVQPVVAGLGDLEPVHLKVGSEADLDDVAERLSDAAYTRVDMVERRGEFAVRGGLLDVFPPTEPHPLRVEFFGDEVDEIRAFSVADQRSIAEREHVWAPPAREILLTDDVRTRARAAITDFPGAAEMLDKIAGGIPAEGMESLTGILVDQMQSVAGLLPAGSIVLAYDPERCERRVEDLMATTD